MPYLSFRGIRLCRMTRNLTFIRLKDSSHSLRSVRNDRVMTIRNDIGRGSLRSIRNDIVGSVAMAMFPPSFHTHSLSVISYYSFCHFGFFSLSFRGIRLCRMTRNLTFIRLKDSSHSLRSVRNDIMGAERNNDIVY